MSPTDNPISGMQPNQQDQGSGMLPSDAERRLREDAGAIAETAKADFESIKTEAETEISALADEGKRQLGEAIDKAKGLATEQKNLFADQLEGIAGAVSKVASELESQDAATAGYARTIADGVDRFSRTLKERDVDGLIGMAEQFGRKQPGAFMAAAAIAGFAASRFLVASARRREAQMPQRSAYEAERDTGYVAAPSPIGGAQRDTRDTMGGTI